MGDERGDGNGGWVEVVDDGGEEGEKKDGRRVDGGGVEEHGNASVVIWGCKGSYEGS